MPTQIEIIKRIQLDEGQRSHLRDRVAADEHREDPRLCQNWEMESLSSLIFIVLFQETNKPIGLLYRGGLPEATIVSWWLDQKFRGQGIGNEMVDVFADILKSEGVTRVNSLTIEPYRGLRNIASEKLEMRLRAHFGDTSAHLPRFYLTKR
jgi:RimJ/RimL family protein N-acetyltransferase